MFSMPTTANREDDMLSTAEALFADKEYVKSAAVFAATSLPVEDIFLRFVPLNQPSALKELLMAKLEHSGAEEVTQITLLTFWLIELILQTVEDTTSNEDRDLLHAELRSLLSERKIAKCLNPIRHKVYELLASFADHHTLLYYAKETCDYDVIVDYYVRKNKPIEAIEVLQSCNQVELVYQYSGFLMHHCPRQTISLLIALNSVQPLKVLPALLNSISKANQSVAVRELIRYLEHQVYFNKSQEKALLNQLLILYAEWEPKKFAAFLDDTSTTRFHFDVLYVLRVAEELDMHVPCVKLLQRMGLFEDAVDRALLVDMSLAKEVARHPQHEERFRKKLWLKIAEKVVSDGDSFTDFVKESETVAVPDLLPLLPDFQTINLFKKAICTTLQDYTDDLEELKDEMKEAAENLEEIREDLREWRKESVSVTATSRCSICRKNVFFTRFYAFPCQHLFHATCVSGEPDDCLLCGHQIVESIGLPLSNASQVNLWA